MDFITVHRAVHQRELSDCLDKGFNKNGGKGQLNARLLLKLLLIGISPLHDIGYIHIVEGGDMCRSLLRTDHMLAIVFLIRSILMISILPCGLEKSSSPAEIVSLPAAGCEEGAEGALAGGAVVASPTLRSSRKLSISSFETRPSLPLPEIDSSSS